MLKKNIAKALASGVAVAALAAGGLALSSGSSNSSAATSSTTPAVAAGIQVPGGAGRARAGIPMMATPATSAAADKAKAAALAKHPGTVERVMKTAGGGYVVHVLKKDGTEVHVLVSGDFKVTGAEFGGAPMGGAPNTGMPPAGT